VRCGAVPYHFTRQRPYSGVTLASPRPHLDQPVNADATQAGRIQPAVAMAARPTVSVVIPCFRHARFLPGAVRSVVGQTRADWEVILVDDGSPDDTADVASQLISAYADRRIRLVQQANLGVSAARNSGIAVADGRYVLPLDADDEILPAMLERTAGILDTRPDVAIVFTDVQRFGSQTNITRFRQMRARDLARHNIAPVTSLFRREVWTTVGGFNPNMIDGYEDWDFWVAAAEAGFAFLHVAEPLLRYRVSAPSRTSHAANHGPDLVRQIRLNHPAFFARAISPEDLRRHDVREAAALEYASGRRALGDGDRPRAQRFLRRSLRRGDFGIRFRAVVGLGCSIVGTDMESLASAGRRVRALWIATAYHVRRITWRRPRDL
jgi:glycosyltransferase involved in cell wall biosynthesis